MCQQNDYEVRWFAFDLCRSSCTWLLLLKRSLKGDRGGFGESILKRNVFSEALATLFPTAILQIDYTTVHIALSTNPLVWWPLLVTILNIINYPFVNVNVSKRLKSSKGVLILPLQALGVIEIAWHCQNNVHSQFWRNRQIYI